MILDLILVALIIIEVAALADLLLCVARWRMCWLCKWKNAK